jgi:HupE / UreJ protein
VTRAALVLGAACLLPFAAAADASAHTWSITEVRVRLGPDRRFEVDVRFDADALLAGVVPGHVAASDSAALRALSASERARRVDELRAFLASAVQFRFDGRRENMRVLFPNLGEGEEPVDRALLEGNARDRGGAESDRRATAGRLPGEGIRFAGEMPSGARAFTIRAPEAFGTLLLSIDSADGSAPARRIVKPGEESEPIPIGSRPGAGRLGIVALYVRLGFEHIVPKGLDHILFVLGLFLASARASALLKQVTAFTVAHSITLALAMYGVVALSPRIVEPLIALSIAYVAFENAATSEIGPWRSAVVFVFGLLHGLGFAGVLRELGLPRSEFATALVSFNVGVELGQIAVIAAAFALVGWCRRKPWFRMRVVVPASLAIALVGAFWAVQRAIG